MKNIDLLITLTKHENDANNVTIAFTMGIKSLEKGYATEILLLSDGVNLASKGYGDKIDIGEPFQPIKDLIPKFLELGGSLKVCSACMIHNNVSDEDLLDKAEVVGAEYVIDAIMESKKTLQLN